ncbi:uncharacterized protein J4E88_003791 [Alternaria novae-zelandiae]|uniref:uncharacterized protein n=1 Tax=Alternaria novae-zelandiae TaxID=430562 RepID=UPI0020C3A222|nr:uncharacterized protein J4E88_003791 [Alternaria novae-zelandiae]KAI4685954.1 hypothetical protein J4E88_003791 [Alternaria novae-zelandiae]
MNASATIRASYIRQARMSMTPRPHSISETLSIDLQPRPASTEKLQSFVHVDHIEHREKCHSERTSQPTFFDVERNADNSRAYIDDRYLDTTSVMEWDNNSSFKVRLKSMFTVFPYRDPIYLVAIIFLIGSIDLVINATFDLLPRLNPSTEFETEETVAVPSTILIGSIFFFVAGIFDTFSALNADRGTLETSKLEPEKVRYRPALLGTPEFKWIPSWEKVWELSATNLAFQAGLIVLFGGIIFMFAGIVDFPGIVPEEDPLFGYIVFGPQVVHGALFLVANAMLAFSEQERWYKPRFFHSDWQSAILNALGGLGFMMAGFFLFQGGENEERGKVHAAIAAMAGSWAFLAVQDHLPRELRDMVYAELMDFENPSFDIWLEGSRYVLKTTNKPRSTFFHRTNMAASVARGQDPYYIDPSIVGKESALEILQLRYRRGQFNIHHDALISRVLNQDAWKQDIVPKRWLSKISIYMPEDIYQVEERRILLRQRFDLLQQLTNTRARIQVIFPSKEMYWHSQIGPSRKGYECLLPTDPTIRQAMLATTERLSVSNVGTEIDAAVHNENVHIIMETIFPSLMALKARGHQIHLDDRISGWKWTAGEGSATFADAWTNRRRFRKDASLHVIAERLRAEKERFDCTLQELYSWKEKQLSTLEGIEKRLDPDPRSGPPSLAASSKDGATMKLGLAERRINAELRKRSEIEPKELYIHQTLADVLGGYAKLVHPGLLDRMFGSLPTGKLPREVRDMVYDHLLPRENTYTIKLATNNTGFSIHKGAPDGTLPTPPIGCPYPMISTTHPLADEILERFHWRSTFIIQKYICTLQPLSIHDILAKLPWWSNIDAGVLPITITGRITFAMRFDNSWRIESDIEKTIGDLRKIVNSASLGVTVSLSIFPADSKRGAEFLDLAKPLLLELQEKGHEIRMIDLACWTKMHRRKEPPT